MSITPQERELVIISAAVGCGCKACIKQDMLIANQLHVADTDIADAVEVALEIRRNATNDIENFTSSSPDDTLELKLSSAVQQNQRNTALASVSAAFAANCVSSLKQQIAAAKAIGIGDKELDAVVSLSSFVKAMAASHVERLMSPNEFEDDSDTLAEYGTPFGPERCAWTEVCKAEAAARSSGNGADDLIRLAGTL
ncbi:MAG: hypothetical protein QGH93_03035 [Gammaproteobacteria bacterium]|jgi:alkylhydroperoxidase family enzyme|nr:hypothetical protein [Chromatiales bacterium]MDP6673816.1 hypothetical protein [Gammaproteobacteria bacterium]